MAAVAVAVALVLAACGGGGDEEAAPPPTPIAEPTTVPADPYAIPPVIDAAYVNRVLEGIDAAVGEVVRIVYRTRDVPPEVIDRLKAIYLERDDINLQLASLQHDLRQRFAGYRENPGNVRSSVDQTITVSRSCVFVRIARNYSEVVMAPDKTPSIEWIGLKPRDSARDPNQYNPTPWMVAVEGLRSDGAPPPNPCDTP